MTGWLGSLQLEFQRRGTRTAVSRQRHEGPLLIQRPFYPESDGTCHVYLVHPPGGVVGGDRLRLHVRATSGARALLTTPAATKLYRSRGSPALLEQTLEVAAGARLEWLPGETIAFDGSRARVDTRVELAGDAAFFGWEVLCLGRPAAGERFTSGAVRLGISVSRGGEPLLRERLVVDQESGALDAPWGLRGHAVIATVVATQASSDDLARARAVSVPEGLLSATLVSDLLVCRYLGDRTDAAQRALRRLWEALRPALLGAAAHSPRIWAT